MVCGQGARSALARSVWRGRYARPGWFRIICLSLCLCVSLVCFGQAGLIHAKAVLAQVLLERAWQRGQAQGMATKPWPWADIRPIAVLSAPTLGVQQYVLDDHSGEALAFGPGLVMQDSDAGSVKVLAGHRDTHFNFLQHLAPGMRVTLTVVGREPQTYEIRAREILDARIDDLPLQRLAPTLFLVTCYPFDAVSNRGPWRFVLTATAVRD